MFQGIDTTWDRVEGGSEVAKHIQNAKWNFNPENTALILKDLSMAYLALGNINDEHWKKIKAEEIRNTIKACLGLYLEIKASDYAYTPGDSISLSIEAINRSDEKVMLSSISISQLDSYSINQELNNNSPFNSDKNYVLSENMEYSQPYWLKKEG